MPENLSPNIPLGARKAEEQEAIGRRLFDLISVGESQKSDSEDWWNKVESWYENRPKHSDGLPAEYVRLHIPFSQPRQDMLTAKTCGVVASQDPYMIARDYSGRNRQDRIEKVVHFFWSNANFPTQIRKGSTIATNTNKVIFKETFQMQVQGQLSHVPENTSITLREGVTFVGLNIDVIHPRHFVCTPAGLGGIKSAVLVGNAFFQRVQQIKEKQNLGIYFKDKTPAGGDDPMENNQAPAKSGAQQGIINAEKENHPVKCYDVIVRLPAVKKKQKIPGPEPLYEEVWAIDLSDDAKGAQERYYRATYAYNEQILLDIEEYPYSRPWYFEGSYIPNTEGYWPQMSVGRNLSGLQDAWNKIHSALYNGGMIEMGQPIIGNDLVEKFSKYGLFDVIDSESPATPWTPGFRFTSAGVLLQQLQILERVGDMVARVSQNQMGATAQHKTTATTDAIIAGGVQEGAEEYIANFTMDFPSMADFGCELLADNYPLWAGIYADVLPVMYTDPQTMQPKTLKEDLEVPVMWEVSGKTPGNTPAAQGAAAERLMAIAMNPQSGLKVYELAKVMVKTSGLAGADSIQMTPEEMMMIAQQAQMEANANQPVGSEMAGDGGGQGATGMAGDQSMQGPEEAPVQLPNGAGAVL